MMQISTGEEALEAFGVERPMGEAGGIGSRAMAASTLIGGLACGLRGRYTLPAGDCAPARKDRPPKDADPVCCS